MDLVIFTYISMHSDERRCGHMEPNQFCPDRRNANRGDVCLNTNVNNLGGKDMKKFIFILALVAAVGIFGCKQAEASRRHHSKTVVQEVADDGTSVTGVKLDAPNLVKIDEKGDWTLGLEGGKAIMRGIFGDERDYVEADKGYFAFLKLTYNGCLLNCNEGE